VLPVLELVLGSDRESEGEGAFAFVLFFIYSMPREVTDSDALLQRTEPRQRMQEDQGIQHDCFAPHRRRWNVLLFFFVNPFLLLGPSFLSSLSISLSETPQQLRRCRSPSFILFTSQNPSSSTYPASPPSSPPPFRLTFVTLHRRS
jgi:hypothetical protein